MKHTGIYGALLSASLGGCSPTVAPPGQQTATTQPVERGAEVREARIELSDVQQKGVATEVLTRAQQVPRTLLAGAVVEMSPGGSAVLSAPEVARVARIDVEPGQVVKQGQVLMHLDVSAVALARAEVQRGKALSSRAEQLVNQEKQLSALNATNTRDRSLAEQELDVAQADLAAAYGRLKAWGASGGSGSSVVVRASMAGVVSQLNAVSGAVVEPGSVLLRILDPQAWNLRVWIPQAWAARVAAGKSLEVLLPGDASVACLAKNLGHFYQVDPETRAVPFRAIPATECAQRLFEGATVEVRVPLHAQATDTSLYQTKASALSTYGEKPMVFIHEHGSGAYSRVFIRDVESWGDAIYFRAAGNSSVKLDDLSRVVVSGTALLKGELMRGELE